MPRRPLVALVAALLAAGCGDRPPARSPTPPTVLAGGDIRILFVGNSHTHMHDLPELVADLIRFRRPGTTVATLYGGVNFLEDTARDPTVRQEIEGGAWTAVVLQAQKISTSGRFHYSRADGLALARLAKGKGAAVVFYPEWGLKGKAGDGARQEAVYREMAAEAGVRVAPVARGWDIALAERPDLPLHADDGNHQTALGAFLTACVLAGRLTGDDPAPLADFPHPAGSPDERRFLAGVAARALAGE